MKNFTGKQKKFVLAFVMLSLVLATSACAPATPAPTKTPVQTPVATPGATTSAPANPVVTPIITPTSSPYNIDIATKTGIGNYLVDSKGMTLYYWSKESQGKSTVTGVVLQNWPLFYVASPVLPGSLKNSDFSKITRDDGSFVTAYKGWALYYFVGDKASGDTNGQGVNGFFVVNPNNFPPQSASPSAVAPFASSAPPASSTPALSPIPTTGY